MSFVDYTAELQPGPTFRCWRFPDPGSWHRDSGDAGAIAGMTRDTMARMNIDPERVYEVDYLLAAANRYLARAIRREEIDRVLAERPAVYVGLDAK